MEKTEKQYKQLSSEERATIMLMTRERKALMGARNARDMN